MEPLRLDTHRPPGIASSRHTFPMQRSDRPELWSNRLHLAAFKLKLSLTFGIQVKLVGIDWFDLDSESRACSGDSLYENPFSAFHSHDTRNRGTREGDFSAFRTRIAPPSKTGKPHFLQTVLQSGCDNFRS